MDRDHTKCILVLFYFSGAAALIYQVLWVRDLGLMLGSTAQAAALVVAIFFAGMASGGWFWGRRAARTRRALSGFGLLELGVACTALAYFGLGPLYHGMAPRLLSLAGDSTIADTFLKAMVASVILLPSSFLMGGTLPMMTEHIVRTPGEFGRRGSLLYAINTAGGASGALAAGFLLPAWLGFRGAYLVAVGLDAAVGLTAYLLSRRMQPRDAAITEKSAAGSKPATHKGVGQAIAVIAFISGFATLGTEVIWTRLFAQVLQNSVYTYALVLVTFLAALALGSTVANRLCRLRIPPVILLAGLTCLAAMVTALSPWLFYSGTSGLGYVGAGLGWWEYLVAVTRVTVVVMLLPGIVIGVVLPFSLRVMQQHLESAGRAIGKLMAINTVGAIVGALVTGFGLLPMLGAWRTMLVLAALYFPATAFLLLKELDQPLRALRWATPLLCLGLVLPFLPVHRLRAITLDTHRDETLVDLIEGSHATAAVIERGGHKLIRVNNHYTLGGSGALESERNQALIPLLLHPEPNRVFFLGMGTGITAGAALQFPVEEITVCELLPEVVTLARRHLGPWVHGLFEDPRVTIHAQDGRNHLRRSPDRYDVIISDLFTPWEAGTGNLYTREHFQTVADRLKPGGLFAQWIPTYQVSRKEFSILANTMDAVFDQVLLWRGDLFPDQSAIALVGMNEAQPLDPQVPVAHGRALSPQENVPTDLLEAVALRFYAGNISASGLFHDAPINTDNRPLIEYLAPRTQRRVQAGRARWLTGDQLGILYGELAQRPGDANDPYLAQLDARQRGYVAAGRSYFFYGVYRQSGDNARANFFLDDFLARTPFQRPPLETRPVTPAAWEEPAPGERRSAR